MLLGFLQIVLLNKTYKYPIINKEWAWILLYYAYLCNINHISYQEIWIFAKQTPPPTHNNCL